MKGKAGSGNLTKPAQPKAPEDNYQKGSKNKNKRVAFEDEDEADDESEEEAPAPARIGPPTSRKIRELPYVNVPSLTPVVRADRPKPKETEGPAYTTRAPIEKEELGQEVLEEILSASLDVTVRQLLGTAPSVRKELMKQLAKVRRAPSEEPIRSQPNRSQYKATVEDVTDDIIESSNSENDECPRLEEEIDVATLPVARSTTVLSENGRKRVITMGDPVVQYLSSLQKGESPKTFYMKESSLALRSIYPLVNNARQEEALLDSGSQIVSMSKDAAISLKMSWDPDISINMQSAQGHVEPTLGLATDVPFTFGDLTVMLQVHIINKPSYKILLGRPFDALTRSTIQNEKDGSQMVTITDPASDHRIVLPTYPRNQGPSRAVKEDSESFQ